MDKQQIEAGNAIAMEVREAVKDIGWEDTAFAAMLTHVQAAKAFFKHIPEKGRAGQTIGTTDKFFEDYQELVTASALLIAVLAEKVDMDLTMHASEPN